MRSRAAVCACTLAAAAMVLSGAYGRSTSDAGAAQTASFTREFCYVINNSPASIAILSVDLSSGALKMAGQITVGAKSDALGALAVPPSAKFLYVGDSNESGSRMLGFAIDPVSGTLTAIAKAPVAVAPAPVAAIVDHRGEFLYVASQTPRAAHGALSVFALDARTGRLAPVTGSPFGAGYCAGNIAIDPSDRFLYLAGCSVFGKLGAMPSVLDFRIDANSGAPTPIATQPFGVGTSEANQPPSGVAVDRAGHRVFAADLLGGSVWVFDIKPDSGALTPIPSSPFLVAAPGLSDRPSSLALHSADASLFTTLIPAKRTTPAGAGSVSAFAIDETGGALKPVAGSPYKAGTNPVAAVVEPSGRFLYVLNRDDATVSAYRIAADGTLARVEGSPFAIDVGERRSGLQPSGLAVAGIR
jgi:6-phosphogluconolactonase